MDGAGIRLSDRPAVIGLAVLASLLVQLSCMTRDRSTLVNFSHLDHLSEEVTVKGNAVTIAHIYSRYPDYAWVDAKESGPEGIACVDDAARAAVLCLRDFELHGRSDGLKRAKGFLNFVLTMQADDGDFYNFVFEDRSINRDGRTSFKSFGWWAARGIWALAAGARVYREPDSAFAATLRRAVERSLPRVRALVERYGEEEVEAGFRIPRWLLYESGTDATSELLLGLIEYYRVAPSDECAVMMRKLADGLMVMQDGGGDVFPFGLHRSWKTIWHMWGNGQTQALAELGRILDDSTMIASARREADGWYVRLLCNGFAKEMDVRDPASRQEYEQIAYGVRPMAVGLIRLYEATGRTEYLRMAGLAAAWLMGNNPVREPMYDPESGRGYDGISSERSLNRNSGAESTIEALLTLTEVEKYPEARKYLEYRRVSAASADGSPRVVFVGPDGNRVTLKRDTTSGVVLTEGGEG
jgi:hypothetical protein